MGDVDIFKAELEGSAAAMSRAVSELDQARADLTGEGFGIENPAGRAGLRLAVRGQIETLRDTALNRSVAASTLSANVQAIADDFGMLDDELFGK
ncbi:hypothetical protein [Ruania alba]|uniref:Uncharacterized protein n=1 Tax=Ruania alba TaxID=648782 RepID=A0A1H5CUK8_9MICO|nr:hypothetical protein [Ruania alba]SED70098.1 hypothetical protein SAMN04488554_0470 [Ruania alba]